MGGLNLASKLRDMGIGAGKSDSPKIILDAIYTHPASHALHHPRIDDPIDEAFVLDIMERGVHDDVLVRQEFDAKDKEVFALCDGAQRIINGREAQRRLREQAKKNGGKFPRPLNEDGNLPIPIELFRGDDKEFLRERQLRDKRPFQRAHSITVLAKSILAMARVGCTPDEIFETMPKGWTKQLVRSVLEYWHTLDKKLVKRFDDGEASVVMLAAVLNAPPSEREQAVETLIATQPVSPAAATRALTTAARKSAQVGDADDADEGKGEALHPPATPPEKHKPGRPAGSKNGSTPKTPRGPTPTPGQRVRVDTIEKIVEASKQKTRLTKAERAFFLGAKVAALVTYETRREFYKELADEDPQVQHAIAGVMYRLGIWDDKIEGLVGAGVLETIDAARNGKKGNEDDAE